MTNITSTTQSTRFSNWVCAECFDDLKSAGQFAGVDHYGVRPRPYDCEQCGFYNDHLYSLYIEL